jgi:superfamily I DNA and/or RNA helicase
MRIDSHGETRERLRVGSVDAFQGKEFDVVLLSLVRSRKIRDKDKAKDLFGFAAVENRLCVALSRQKRLLIVVGDKRMVRSEQAKALKGLPALLELCEDEDSQTLRSRA